MIMISYTSKLFLLFFICTTFITLFKLYYPKSSTLVHIKHLDKHPSEDEVIQLFKDWKKENGRVYKDNEEMANKFVIFISNLNYIIEYNVRKNSSSSHVLGLNKYFDWSPEEFKETYSNLDIPTNNDIDWRVKRVMTAVKNQGSNAFGYDFLAFSVLWPKGVCINVSCTVIPNYFSIHGLWPSTRSKDQPRDCNSTYTFPPNEKNMEKNWNPNLVKNIKQYWISLQKTNYKFWSGEWKHHGTCAKKDDNTSLNVEQYFTKTMDAYLKYKVRDVLNLLSKTPYPFFVAFTNYWRRSTYSKSHQKVPIIPGKEYSFDTLIAAFKAAFSGTEVTLKCKGANTSQGQFLTEVLIYMDNHLNKIKIEEKYKLTNCDKNMKVLFTG